MARLFVGVLVPEDMKDQITDFQGSLGRMPMNAKLIERKNLHISLTFLGEIPEEEISSVTQKLDSVCKNYKKFTVKIGGGMMIPNEDYIRVIALNATSNDGVLEKLREDIVNNIGGDSHPAHLTLARVRDISDKRLVSETVRSCKVESYFEIGSVSLIKSVITGRGPRYRILHQSPFL